jgi:hypothetical protein
MRKLTVLPVECTRELPILSHLESEIADELAVEIRRVLPVVWTWCQEGLSDRGIPGVLVPIIVRGQQRACLALLRELFDQPNLEEAVGLKLRELEIEVHKTDQTEGA